MTPSSFSEKEGQHTGNRDMPTFFLLSWSTFPFPFPLLSLTIADHFASLRVDLCPFSLPLLLPSLAPFLLSHSSGYQLSVNSVMRILIDFVALNSRIETRKLMLSGQEIAWGYGSPLDIPIPPHSSRPGREGKGQWSCQFPWSIFSLLI